MEVLSQWFQGYGLFWSPQKSKAIVFRPSHSTKVLDPIICGESIILWVKETKYLGIVINENLKWNKYIAGIEIKAKKGINAMRAVCRVWWGADPLTLVLIYRGIVRSHIDYASIILKPTSIKQLEKLDKLQFEALRAVSGCMRSTPTNALLAECGEISLEFRRNMLARIFVLKNLAIRGNLLIGLIQKLLNCCESQAKKYWKNKAIPYLAQAYRCLRVKEDQIQTYDTLPCFNFDFLKQLRTVPVLDLGLFKGDLLSVENFMGMAKQRTSSYTWFFTDASKDIETETVRYGVFCPTFNIQYSERPPSETQICSAEIIAINRTNETTKENKKIENNIDQSITETSSIGSSKEANSDSFKSLNQNQLASSVFEEEDCFQDAEINPTINTIHSTEMPTKGRDSLLTLDLHQDNPLEQIANTDVSSNNLSTGTTKNNQQQNNYSDFEIHIPKNGVSNEELNKNGNVKMVSHTANTIEPDSLNDSMVDSLELVTIQDIPLTQQLIDSIDTIRCDNQNSTLNDEEVDKYESLEYDAIDSLQNLNSAQNHTTVNNTDIKIVELGKNFSLNHQQNKDDATLSTSGVAITCKENVSIKSKPVSLNDILDFPIKVNIQSSKLEELHSKSQTEAKEISISDSTENFISSECTSKSESALETLIRSVNHTFAINDSVDENTAASNNIIHVSSETISEPEQISIRDIKIVDEKGDRLEQKHQEFVDNTVKLSSHEESMNYCEQVIKSEKDILFEMEVENQKRKCDEIDQNVKKLKIQEILRTEIHIESNEDSRNTLDTQNSTKIPLKNILHFENQSEENLANSTNNSETPENLEIEMIQKQISHTPENLNKKTILMDIRDSEGSVMNTLPESNTQLEKQHSKIAAKRFNKNLENGSKAKRDNDLGEITVDNVQNNKPTASEMKIEEKNAPKLLEIVNLKPTLIERKQEVTINIIQPIEINNDILIQQKCNREFDNQNTQECQNIAQSEEILEKGTEPKTEEIREDLAQKSMSDNEQLNNSDISAEQKHESKSPKTLEQFQENLGNKTLSPAQDLAADGNNGKENSELKIKMETQDLQIVETLDSTFVKTTNKLSQGEDLISKEIDETSVADNNSNKEKSGGLKITTDEKNEPTAENQIPKSITTEIVIHQMDISHTEKAIEQNENSVLEKQENEFNVNSESCSKSQIVQESKTEVEKKSDDRSDTDMKQTYNTAFDTKDFEKLEKQCKENKEPEVIHRIEEIASNSADKREENEQTIEQSNKKYERQDTKEFENLERQCAENFKDTNKLRNEDILTELVTESNEQSYTTNENQDVEQDHSRIFYRQNTYEFEIMERQCTENVGDIKSLRIEENIEKLATSHNDDVTDESNEFVTNIKLIEQHKLQPNQSLEMKSQNVQELTTNHLKAISVVGEENNILYDRQDTQEFENLERQCKDMADDLNIITDGILGELVAQSTNTNNVKTSDSQTKLRQSDDYDILEKVKDVIVDTTNNKGTQADKNDEQGIIIEQDKIVKETTTQIHPKSIFDELTAEKQSVSKEEQKEESVSSLNKKEQSSEAPSVSEYVQSHLLSSAVDDSKNSAVEKDKATQSNIDDKLNTDGNYMKTIDQIKSTSCMGAETFKRNSISATDEVMENTLPEASVNYAQEKKPRSTIEVPSDTSNNQSKTKSVSLVITEEVQKTTNPKLSNKNVYQPVYNEQNNRNEELKSKVDLLQQELDSIRKRNRRKDKRMPTSTEHKDVDKDIISKYKTILEEYEKHIVQQADDLEKLKMDSERNVRHFTNTEMAFSDVFEKYEKAKFVIAAYRKNEDILLENIKNAEDQLSQVETKCFSMKQQSVEQIRCAQEQVEQDKRRYGQEISKLQAQVKRLEIKASSLEFALTQKSDECQALVALCDDITGRNST